MKKILSTIVLLLSISGVLFAQDPSLTMTVTIPVGASISGDYSIRAGCIPAGIITPTTWTAANITFQISNDNGVTWGNLRDRFGTEYTVTVITAGDVIDLPPADWYWKKNRKFRIRSGIASAPVVQLTTDKEVKVACGR